MTAPAKRSGAGCPGPDGTCQRLEAVQLEGISLQHLDPRAPDLGGQLRPDGEEPAGRWPSAPPAAPATPVPSRPGSRVEHGGQHKLLVGGEAVAAEADGHRVVGGVAQELQHVLPVRREAPVDLGTVDGQHGVAHCGDSAASVSQSARPGPVLPARRRRTADAVALSEGDDDALVVRAQDEVEREAERLLGVGAGRVVVQLVDEAARLVHHIDAEDRHGAARPAPEAASRRAPEAARDHGVSPRLAPGASFLGRHLGGAAAAAAAW